MVQLSSSNSRREGNASSGGKVQTRPGREQQVEKGVDDDDDDKGSPRQWRQRSRRGG